MARSAPYNEPARAEQGALAAGALKPAFERKNPKHGLGFGDSEQARPRLGAAELSERSGEGKHETPRPERTLKARAPGASERWYHIIHDGFR